MDSRCVLSWFTVMIVMLASILGCSKKEDSSTTKDEVESKSSIQATESAEQSISPLMDQFLRKTAGSRKTVSAGTQMSEFFTFWETFLQHPRNSMNIYFDVELEETFQKDHAWEKKTNQEVLDDLCKEYNLNWEITDSDTIRISKKADV